MSIFANLLEAWRVAQADRLIPGPNPAGNLQRLALAGGYDEAMAIHDALRDPDALPLRALQLAIADIGRGEEGGNNRGPYVAECVAPAKVPQNWCAGSFGRWYALAADELHVELPFKRSLGAKRLGRNIAKVGRKFVDPREARPGDAMVFHRGAKGSWMGHIAMVERLYGDDVGTIGTVEGNAGPRVCRKQRWVDRDRFAYFASLRR